MIGGGVTFGLALYVTAQTGFVSAPLSISAAIKGGSSFGAGIGNIFNSFQNKNNQFITSGVGENIGNSIAVFTGNENAQIVGRIVDLAHDLVPGPSTSNFLGNLFSRVQAGENLFGAGQTLNSRIPRK